MGKRLDVSVQSLAIEELVMRALRHLRGLARSIYSRAMLAQVKVVSNGTEYLARRGIRYAGQILTPGTSAVPRVLPADPEGIRGLPRNETILLNPGWTSRLRQDIANTARMWDTSLLPQATGPGTLFTTFLPLQEARWLPNEVSHVIAQIWTAAPPVRDAESWLMQRSRSGAWEHTGTSRIFPVGLADRALRLSCKAPLDAYGTGDSDETRFQLPHEGPGKPVLLATEIDEALLQANQPGLDPEIDEGRPCGRKRTPAPPAVG